VHDRAHYANTATSSVPAAIVAVLEIGISVIVKPLFVFDPNETTAT
jgi:hypothetical protein